MKKKLLSLLLAFCMIAVFMPTMAFATPDKPYEGKLVILHTNDVHGAIDGYQYVAGLKAQYEEQGADVLLVDAGDYSQGSVNVSISKGENAVTMMNKAGYDLATLGNHEFDYGYDQLESNLAKADFDVVCCNIANSDNTQSWDASKTFDKGGVKVGFIGIDTPEAQTKVNPALITGLKFNTNSSDPTLNKVISDQVEALKTENCDVVIALAHLGVDNESKGNRSYDVLNSFLGDGIDFVIDGHSHTVMVEGENGEAIQSTGTALENVGVIVIDETSKEIESHNLYTLKENGNYKEGLASDATVKAAADEIINAINTQYGQKFATSEVNLNGAKAPMGNRDSETNNGDLITDAMVYSVMQTEGIKDVAADHVVAITNGGGIRAAIGKGDVTKKMIKDVLPFGNTVAVVYVTGAELLKSLEASTYCTPTSLGAFPQIAGMEITVDATKPYDPEDDTYPGSTYSGPKTIQRVTINSVNGEEFKPEDKYAVITNNFCAAGGDTYYAFKAATSQFDTGIPLDEALMDYITKELKGTIDSQYAAPQDRIKIYEGHKHIGEWTLVKAPTCTEPGELVRACLYCGQKETGKIAALGHSLKHVAEVKAIYLKDGVKAHYECSVCGAMFADENGETAVTAKDLKIAKKAAKVQKLTVKAAKKTFKVKSLKKKADSVKLKVTAKGNVTYKLVKGSTKYVSLSKDGKVTFKKGCKKGTYKVKVLAAATKDGQYKKAETTVTFTVK